MRLVAHLSDLHFGRHDPIVAAALLASLRAATPDLIVISGDLTQRARRREFAAARAFLDEIAAPAVVVPGNHDLPLYDVGRRFVRPLARFRRYISADVEPWFCDEELAVLGLNTARRAAFANGRISRRQLATLRGFFARTAEDAFRILVVHHPLIAPVDAPRLDVAVGAARALDVLAEAGIRLVLAGHHHRVFAAEAALRHPLAGRALLNIQAGTAISTRRRHDPNAFNLLRIERDRVTCMPQCWRDDRFAAAPPVVYAFTDGGWQIETAPAA